MTKMQPLPSAIQQPLVCVFLSCNNYFFADVVRFGAIFIAPPVPE